MSGLNAEVETGMRFRKLILRDSFKIEGHRFWNVSCDCGVEKIVRERDLRSGGAKSYGCIKRSPTKRLPPPPCPDAAALIPLSKGRFAIVDAEDYPMLAKFNWYYHSGHYASTSIMENTKKSTVMMHRVILGLSQTDPIHVDHRNGNGLDNRKANLRTASRSQNLSNRGRERDNKSGYKGITQTYTRRGEPCGWQVRCKHTYIGHFKTAEEAALAYDVAARKIYGEFARCNFPDQM